MENGSKPNWGSGKSGRECNPFSLEQKEHIIKLQIWQKQTLHGLVICINNDRQSRFYGSAEGLQQEFIGSVNNPITGIKVEMDGQSFRIIGVELLQLSGYIDSAEQVPALFTTVPTFQDSFLHPIKS